MKASSTLSATALPADAPMGVAWMPIAAFCFLWSSAFAAAKIAVRDCPPLTLLTIRFLIAGALLMGSSFAIPKFDGYLLGNVFLAVGGTFLFVSSFQLANAFPKNSGLIVALVTGAFDASAAVFLFYRMAYEASGGSFSLAKFFFG